MKRVLCILGIVSAGLFGCAGSDGAHEEVSSSDSAPLSTVNKCITQAQTCKQGAHSNADLQTCRADLQQCLSTLFHHHGGGGHGFCDGGAPPFFDAGDEDAAAIDASVDDAAAIDSGVVVPPPIDAGAVVSAIQACVNTLESCLSSTTDPIQCAQQARLCLIHAAH